MTKTPTEISCCSFSQAANSDFRQEKEPFINTSKKKNDTVEVWQSTREIFLSVSAELLCPPDDTACTVCSISLTDDKSEIW